MRMVVLGILAVLATPALAARKEDPKLVAARDASLAMAAPALCPKLKVDDEAVTAFLARAQLTETDLADTYRMTTQAAVTALRQAAASDPAQACSDIQDRLGIDGLGLLTAEGDD